MIILGVDPGTNFTGFGIININKNTFTRIVNGIIKLPANKSLTEKLEIIYDELNKLIRKYKPDEFAIETAFYGKNVQSAMKIGYARGVSLLAAIHNKVPTSEYSPREIKKSVVGNGAASKQQVSFMIKSLLDVKKEKMKFDESDALAIALCHAFRVKNVSKKSKDWKSFVEANPDRIVG
ncbi:MAG TPA: crossover junction endodeoxyribonuclease RuvC [Ignavibacteriaceae bacterium]|nr:crossover junction endodeoxyribonuclease RuvC [Ignavibacteriaceae bacterium]